MEHLVIENGIVKDGKKCEGEIRIPEGVTEIANQAFYQNKKITGIYLPDGVRKIGKYTVNGCENLSYVRVPKSVESLGESGLVKKFESNCGFTHTIQSTEGSWIDQKIGELIGKGNQIQSHSTTYVVEMEYEE